MKERIYEPTKPIFPLIICEFEYSNPSEDPAVYRLIQTECAGLVLEKNVGTNAMGEPTWAKAEMRQQHLETAFSTYCVEFHKAYKDKTKKIAWR